MEAKQRNRLMNFNRLLIFVLSLIGLLMDGVQHADLPFTIALMVWLWLAVFAQMEVKILDGARSLSTSVRKPGRSQRQCIVTHGASVRNLRAGASRDHISAAA